MEYEKLGVYAESSGNDGLEGFKPGLKRENGTEDRGGGINHRESQAEGSEQKVEQRS